MKRVILILFIYFFIFSPVLSQNNIKGTVKGIIAKKVYLRPLFGFDNRNIDSADVSNSSFTLNLSSKTIKGFYRLDIGKDLKGEFYNEESKYLYLILNTENIEFTTNINNPFDSITFINSLENKLYYDFNNKNHLLNVQLGILDQLPEYFPKNDDFYPSIISHYKKVQKKSAELYNNIFSKHQNTFAAHISKSLQIPMMDIVWTPEKKYMFVIEHYFDNVNFNDTLLLKTDIFSTKTLDYIKMYRNNQISPDEQAKEYIKAVDIILTKAKVNDKVFKFILDYIIRGFEQLEMDEVLVYISDNYMKDSSCSDDKTSSTLNKRVESYKKLTVGSYSPEVIITDNKGKITKLSEINTDYTIVLFYASWCPHCTLMLPEIKDIYDKLKAINPKSLEVIAVSLDTVKTEWLGFIQKGQYNWINYCDFKSWNSKITMDYFVYATPTMILVDKQKKIVSKPITIQQLKSILIEKGLVWEN